MLSRSEERLILALRRRKERVTRRLFLAEGVRVAEDLVSAPIDLSFAVVSPTLEDTTRGQALMAVLRERVPVHQITDAALRKLAATEQPQGVLVVAHEPTTTLGQINIERVCRILVCDAVQDPGNLGTLIRSAAAFALAGVVLLPGSVDPWNAKVVRSAAGASFHLPLVSVSARELADWLHQHHFQAWGADAQGEPFDPALAPERVALVVGNEGAGLRAETQPLIDRTVQIEMPGHTESLNVGVAAGILMYLLSERST